MSDDDADTQRVAPGHPTSLVPFASTSARRAGLSEPSHDAKSPAAGCVLRAPTPSRRRGAPKRRREVLLSNSVSRARATTATSAKTQGRPMTFSLSAQAALGFARDRDLDRPKISERETL